MNDPQFTIVFALKAQQRLEELADYLFQETQSSNFVLNYLDKLETYLREILLLFPEAGTPMEQQYGPGIRRLTYQKYSVLYRIVDQEIQIFTLFRENLP
jgi:plasmid stabilization system protein ParE